MNKQFWDKVDNQLKTWGIKNDRGDAFKRMMMQIQGAVHPESEANNLIARCQPQRRRTVAAWIDEVLAVGEEEQLFVCFDRPMEPDLEDTLHAIEALKLRGSRESIAKAYAIAIGSLEAIARGMKETENPHIPDEAGWWIYNQDDIEQAFLDLE